MGTTVLAVLIAAGIALVLAGLTWVAGAVLVRWLGDDDPEEG